MQDSQLFSGIKVIAAARIIAAPFAAYQLSMHGADVLTIENPAEPDVLRYSGDRGSRLHQQGMASGFLAHNANKKSLTLNLSTPEGQQIFRRLAKNADVVIENLIVGTMSRYGLGYDDLSSTNPGLIYCSVTGFGQTGPKKHSPGIDGAIQAASGMMSVTGSPETGPTKIGFPLIDYATGFAAALGIVSALYHRERTGVGQYLDVSMMESALVLMGGHATRALTTGEIQGMAGNRSAHGDVVNSIFRCKEGTILITAATEPRRQKLWRALNREDIPCDPRFHTPELCRINIEQLYAEIEATLAERSALEWENVLSQGGLAAMAVRNVAEGAQHPQVQSRNFFHTFPSDPQLGLSVSVPKASYRLSRTSAVLKTLPPRFGQHTDAVLTELGYTMQEIERLRQDGIV